MSAAVLTVPQVATLLNVSRASVYRLIYAGELGETLDVGTGKKSRTRVYATAVEDLMKRRTS